MKVKLRLLEGLSFREPVVYLKLRKALK